MEEGEAGGADGRMGRLCLFLVTNRDIGGEAGQLCVLHCYVSIKVPCPFAYYLERKLEEGEISYILSPPYGEEYLKDKTGNHMGQKTLQTTSERRRRKDVIRSIFKSWLHSLRQ